MTHDYRRIDLKRYAVVPVWYDCNSACTICMLSSVKGALGTMDLETFRRLLTAVAADGHCTALILSGAEVTTFNHLEQYIACAASFGRFDKIQIQTNGRALADRDYANMLVDAGVNEFFVSVHGPERTHDEITRVPGSFAATMAGLENIACLPVNIISNTVLTTVNFPDMVEHFSALSAMAVREMHLWNFFPMDSSDRRGLTVGISSLRDILPHIGVAIAASGKELVLKGFPECLDPDPPCVVDSGFPVNLIQDEFWAEFAKNGFGTCVHRAACSSRSCWGLSSAYREKFGDEAQLLSPKCEDRNKDEG